MNRQLEWITTAGYVSVIILLVIFDYYAIMQYREKNRKNERTLFLTYHNGISDSLKNAEMVVTKYFTQKQTFRTLSVAESEEKGFDSLYDLDNQMKSYITLHENLSGLFLSYKSGRKTTYKFQPDISGNDSEINGSVGIRKANTGRQF